MIIYHQNIKMEANRMTSSAYSSHLGIGSMKKLWKNCHIATMQNGQYSSIEHAAIVTDSEIIHWIGSQKIFHLMIMQR